MKHIARLNFYAAPYLSPIKFFITYIVGPRICIRKSKKAIKVDNLLNARKKGEAGKK